MWKLSGGEHSLEFLYSYPSEISKVAIATPSTVRTSRLTPGAILTLKVGCRRQEGRVLTGDGEDRKQ